MIMATIEILSLNVYSLKIQRQRIAEEVMEQLINLSEEQIKHEFRP